MAAQLDLNINPASWASRSPSRLPIPVYADEGTGDPSIVKVSVEKVQRAGVRTEPVEKRILSEPIHAPGSIQIDERRERSITLRAEGFIEKVYAGATGQHTR